jgi:hypothetical protein
MKGQVCRDLTDFERKLDLTHSYLRAMSPVHLKYLGNMSVRSSMSVSVSHLHLFIYSFISHWKVGEIAPKLPAPSYIPKRQF